MTHCPTAQTLASLNLVGYDPNLQPKPTGKISSHVEKQINAEDLDDYKKKS